MEREGLRRKGGLSHFSAFSQRLLLLLHVIGKRGIGW